MRQLLVIVAMLVSGTISAQAYNCGMFGSIEDQDGIEYIGRFTSGLDSLQLECLTTCEVIHCPVEILYSEVRKRSTKLWIYVDYPSFSDFEYEIKYPKDSWGFVLGRYKTLYNKTFRAPGLEEALISKD